eukprot:TRINITY_DN8458_c0_g1_i2.p1 TRINITY_DN8458_c0_g1~~TRINITY_DN8458_c0_g1_i2.p1  ORF type:complete len:442 (+),score=35.39 TRINITY_DN8458_c0_g1_i2:50-1375(+)
MEAETFKLTRLGLTRLEIVPDCYSLFRATAWMMYGEQRLHEFVRSSCISYMRKNLHKFEPFMDTMSGGEAYLRSIDEGKSPAGFTELYALSCLFQHNFKVYSLEGSPLDINDSFPKTMKLWVSGNHYDCLLTHQEMGIRCMCQEVVYEILGRILGLKAPREHQYRNLETSLWKENLRERQHCADLAERLAQEDSVLIPSNPSPRREYVAMPDAAPQSTYIDLNTLNFLAKHKNSTSAPVMVSDIDFQKPNSNSFYATRATNEYASSMSIDIPPSVASASSPPRHGPTNYTGIADIQLDAPRSASPPSNYGSTSVLRPEPSKLYARMPIPTRQPQSSTSPPLSPRSVPRTGTSPGGGFDYRYQDEYAASTALSTKPRTSKTVPAPTAKDRDDSRQRTTVGGSMEGRDIISKEEVMRHAIRFGWLYKRGGGRRCSLLSLPLIT